MLQQTTKHMQVTADGDLLSSLQTHHRMAGQHTMQSHNSTTTSNHINNNSTNSPSTMTTIENRISNSITGQNSQESHERQTGSVKQWHKPHLHALSATAAVKKQGVSGESSDTTGQLSRDILIPKYEKDFRYVLRNTTILTIFVNA